MSTLRLISHNPRARPGGAVRPLAKEMERRLDALCEWQEQAEAQLYRLPRTRFERACRALRRFCHLRDLMRMRLFAARCGPLPHRSWVHETLHREWPRLLRAAERLGAMFADDGIEPDTVSVPGRVGQRP